MTGTFVLSPDCLDGDPVKLRMALTTLMILVSLMAGGCGGLSPSGPAQSGTDCTNGSNEDSSSQLVDALVQTVSEQYPARFNALHRVGLTYRGSSVILKGFLKIDRKFRDIHLVAQGEMGGALFEVRLVKGKINTLSTNGSFKKSWIEKTVVRDLRILYDAPRFQTPGACLPKGIPTLSDVRAGKRWTYIFNNSDPGRFQLTRTTIRQGREVPEYVIDYTYGLGSALPDFIRIEDRKTGYTLNINVRYIPANPED